MMGILLTLAIILVLLAITSPFYGLMFYLTIRLTIPSCARVGSFSFNTVLFFLLFMFTIKFLLKEYRDGNAKERDYVHAVLLLFIGIFFLSLFSSSIPFLFQFSRISQFFGTEILPSVLFLYFLSGKKDVDKVCNWIVWLALFNSIYGIYTYLTASNPIFEYFNTSQTEARNLMDYASGRFGLSGIAVGIYDDKIAMSLISFLLATFLFDKKCVNKRLRWIVISLTLANMFLTTQRSALFCFLVFLLIFLADKRYKAYRVKVLVFTILSLFFLSLANENAMETLSLVVMIFNDNYQTAYGIGGSSSDMRFNQLANIISYMKVDNLLTGMGYDYSSWYYTYIWDRDRFGMDTRFYGFESFLFKRLLEGGILGVALWGVALKRMYVSCCNKSNLSLAAFFFSYVMAILITDASASLFLFFILLVVNSKYFFYANAPIDVEYTCRGNHAN